MTSYYALLAIIAGIIIAINIPVVLAILQVSQALAAIR